ncbi:MAG: N-acetylneuraminate synthase family protein [Candidatus Aureabacteria bacterium]|nr:N-acetylneuraminate synthase family protein [Candidatus Auribacterota bacterium]
MKRIKIGNKNIGGGSTVIVAEIGSNHGGSLSHALELVRAAKENGADCVKFQSFLADEIVIRRDPAYNILKKLELDYNSHLKIMDYAKKLGIPFFSTCSNSISLGWLKRINVPAIKIASTNLNCLSLIREAALTRKPIFMSTGMSGEDEIDRAVKTIRAAGNDKIVIMHCVSDYPALPGNVNVRYLTRLAKRYGCMVGYSDHTADSRSSILAVALGAVILEKHFTIKKNRSLPDSVFSLNPKQFLKYVEDIRGSESILGSGVKKLTKTEAESRKKFRRSVHARIDIPAGTVLHKEHLKIVRPYSGIDACFYDSVINHKTNKHIRKDFPVRWQDLGKK